MPSIEREKERARDYYQKHREECLAKAKERYTENREGIRKKRNEWAEKNREKLRASYKKRRQNPEFKAKKRAWMSQYAKRGKVIARERARTLRRNYEMSVEDFDCLFLSQGMVCAICGTDAFNGRGPHVDHNHKTGVVRGILCHDCNMAVGFVKDDPKRAMAVAKFLAICE